VGGAEIYLFNLIKEAINKDIDVEVLLCEAHCPVELDNTIRSLGAEVIRVDFGLHNPKIWRVIPQALSVFNGVNADFIFFNKRIDWYDFRHIILAARLKKNSRLIAVEHWHPDGWPNYTKKRYSLNLNLRQRWVKFKCKIYAHCFDAIICMNNVARDVFIAQYSYPPEKLHVIYNGIESKQFTFTLSARKSVRLRFKLPDSQLLVVAAGRLSYEKGYDVLLQSWSMLAKPLRKRAFLCIAGKGEELQSIEKQAKLLGIQKEISFVGQWDDMPALLSAADVFVAPSRRESFGLSIAEAMYVGCCVVATKAGGIPELLGETGVYAEIESPDSLMQGISSLLADESLRKKMAKLQNERVTEKFSLESSMRQTLNLITGEMLNGDG